jgi:hypothetical protein
VRIRSIKPEFWTSESIARLPWSARLLFIALWSYVDDSGVGLDNEKLVVAAVFPLEEDPRETLATVSRDLQTLAHEGRVARYAVEGKRYLSITGWSEHQKIDKPNRARYPSPSDGNASLTCGSRVPRESLATPAGESRETPSPGAVEQRSSGTEEQGEDTCSVEPSEPLSLVLAVCPPQHPAPPTFDDWWSAYPRKVAKGAALKAWTKALKTASANELVAGAVALREDPTRVEKFTPHPATWLNDRRWLDEGASQPPAGRPTVQSFTDSEYASGW